MMRDVSFLLRGGRAGVLLIHGLTGTPSEMQILAKGLHRAGFTVMAMQLAGHCGSEQDLIKTTWEDWYQSVCDAADALRSQVDIMFIGGLSMGALLALKYAADYPEKTAGLGIYGVTFFYDGWSVPFYGRPLGVLVRKLHRMGLFRNHSFVEKMPYGLKDERIRKKVVESMFSGDSTGAGLAANPLPAVAEMLELSAKVRPLLPKITVPCLIMHSSHDDIAAMKTNAGLVADKVAGEVKMVALHDSYHLITIDRDRKNVIAHSAEFFARHCPAGFLQIPSMRETHGFAASPKMLSRAEQAEITADSAVDVQKVRQSAKNIR